eukprot:1974340-Rhodomonas_salina.1
MPPQHRLPASFSPLRLRVGIASQNPPLPHTSSAPPPPLLHASSAMAKPPPFDSSCGASTAGAVPMSITPCTDKENNTLLHSPLQTVTDSWEGVERVQGEGQNEEAGPGVGRERSRERGTMRGGGGEGGNEEGRSGEGPGETKLGVTESVGTMRPGGVERKGLGMIRPSEGVGRVGTRRDGTKLRAGNDKGVGSGNEEGRDETGCDMRGGGMMREGVGRGGNEEGGNEAGSDLGLRER